MTGWRFYLFATHMPTIVETLDLAGIFRRYELPGAESNQESAIRWWWRSFISSS
jgi:hypothetical protein